MRPKPCESPEDLAMTAREGGWLKEHEGSPADDECVFLLGSGIYLAAPYVKEACP